MRSGSISLAPKSLVLGLLLATSAPLLATGESQASCPLTLVDVASASGIDFVHDRGAGGRKRLPETMGAGVAWLDADGDGWLDLYAVQSGPLPDVAGLDPAAAAAARADRLYRNLGPGRDGTVRFEPAGGLALGTAAYGQGVVAGDLDGDGQVDLYLPSYGRDTLLLNRTAPGGGIAFEDATAPAGLGLGGWSSSAALADADGDGRLDLYVVRYLEYDLGHELFCGDFEAGIREYCGPELFAGAGDKLYRNLGPRFADVTASAGLGAPENSGGKGLGVVFTDLDGDGRPDLYVANDQTVNFTFHNRSGDDLRFEDLSFFSGAGVDRQGAPEAGMGVAVGDVDGDGDHDLAVTNFDVETNTLYRNLGALQFEDVSTASGFGLPSFNLLGFGLVLLDLDLDGDLDAYAANGHVRERTRRESTAYAQRDLILLGDGTGRFSEARCVLASGAPLYVGRGLAWADYDRDGDPDLALSNSGGPLQLLRNDRGAGVGAAGSDVHWLGLRILDAAGAPAVGAEAVLRVAGKAQRRVVLAGDSYQSASSPDLRFGLGAGATDAVESLEVRWPSGRRLRLLGAPRNVELLLRP